MGEACTGVEQLGGPLSICADELWLRFAIPSASFVEALAGKPRDANRHAGRFAGVSSLVMQNLAKVRLT